MRQRYHVSLLLLVLVLLPQAVRGQTFFTGHLTAAQETGEVTSEAAGTAVVLLTEEGLRFLVSVNGLTQPIAAAHFHEAPAGEAGPPVRTITDDFEGNSAAGIWTEGDAEPLTDELLRALYAGNLYVNVHTSTFPGGEIRAQLHPASGAGLSATLTPQQETGAVTSDASGTAAVLATPDGVAYFITVEGLTAPIAAAHFHTGAIGVSGPPVRTITGDFEGNTAFGLWSAQDAEPLTGDLLEELLTGGLYLNVHTATFPAGEVRGQVLLTSGWGFFAQLDAEQETGEVASDATGTASFTLTDLGLVYRITAQGLTGAIAAAHFHTGGIGVSGPPVRTITGDFDGTTATGLWTPDDDEPLTEARLQSLLAGTLYVNLHTPDHPGGEIRGQVLLEEGTHLAAELTPEQETDAVTSEGAGTASLVLTSAGLAFDITVEGLTGPIVAAHFHRGEIGVSGPPVRTITGDFEGNVATGLWTAADAEPLTDELREALMTGDLYLNVHTGTFPAGEVRGQVYVTDGAGLRASLTNEQETAAVTQEASGTATLTLTSEGVAYWITAEGLSGPIAAAHFHTGGIGVSGPPVRTITGDFDGTTAEGLWAPDDAEPLTEALVEALLTGGIYLNLHTGTNPGGEVRGQVVLSGGTGAAVRLDGEQEPEHIHTGAHGTAALVLTEAGLVFDATAEGLSSAIVAAHFHEGPLGENGPPVRTLTDDFEGTTATGVWRAGDAEPLTPELLGVLTGGGIYLNVHTANAPGGEIRGQVWPGSIVVTAAEGGAHVPRVFQLDQNYPNPFNPETTVRFQLQQAETVRLAVYDVLGREVARLLDRDLPAGAYTVRWDGRGTGGVRLASGPYLYRLEAGGQAVSRVMTLLK